MFDWIRGDKYRIKSKEWFETECIKEDGFIYIMNLNNNIYLKKQ